MKQVNILWEQQSPAEVHSASVPQELHVVLLHYWPSIRWLAFPGVQPPTGRRQQRSLSPPSLGKYHLEKARHWSVKQNLVCSSRNRQNLFLFLLQWIINQELHLFWRFREVSKCWREKGREMMLVGHWMLKKRKKNRVAGKSQSLRKM